MLKIFRRILAISKLSCRETLIKSSVIVVNMERPCFHSNYTDILMISFVTMVTAERSCYYGNHRDIFMTSFVAIITTEKSCYYGNFRDIFMTLSVATSTAERLCCYSNYRDTLIMSSIDQVTRERDWMHRKWLVTIRHIRVLMYQYEVYRYSLSVYWWPSFLSGLEYTQVTQVPPIYEESLNWTQTLRWPFDWPQTDRRKSVFFRFTMPLEFLR